MPAVAAALGKMVLAVVPQIGPYLQILVWQLALGPWFSDGFKKAFDFQFVQIVSIFKKKKNFFNFILFLNFT